jgi:hypothetical protein
MAVDVRTNVPVTGHIGAAYFFKAKQEGFSDRLHLKGKWDGTTEDSLFAPLALLDKLVVAGVLSIPAGQTDRFGHPKYVVLKPHATVEIVCGEDPDDKKKRVWTGRIVGDHNPAPVPAATLGTAECASPAPAPADGDAERGRWRAFRDVYVACRRLAEQVWTADLTAASAGQLKLAADYGETVRPITPLDRLYFLKEVTTAMLIEASRRGLDAPPKPAVPPTAAPLDPPLPDEDPADDLPY